MRFLLFLVLLLSFGVSNSQISLTTIGSAYTQDFNSLASSGTTNSALPSGWFFSETGSGANTTYTPGTGSSSTGNTYSFGAAGNSERSLGGLQSGSLNPTIGASFTNNTSVTITSINISYFGEQWRLGATARVDRIDFQYSLNATSLTTGTWIDVNSLDFTAPVTTGTPGPLDGNAAGNRTSISNSITGLSIPNGVTFWIRWTDLNASGSDDGLSVDDFNLTPIGVSGPELNLQTSSINRACGYTYDFGDVLTSGSGSVALTIQNTGTADLEISSLNLSGSSDYTLNSPPSTPFTIAPGGSEVVNIDFAPTSGGTINGALTIMSDDSDEGSCIFNLTGVGVVPLPELNLQISATNRACGFTHNFGSVSTSSSGSVALTIQNTGTADLTISGLALSGSTDYTLNSPPALPFTIAAGGNQVINIDFDPSSAGNISSALTITSNDGDEGTCAVNLTGVGFATVPCSDLFFSEYIEGSSNNKFLEIYNPTTTSVNLSNYSILIYGNGSPTPTSTINLSGTLAPGAVFVVANSGYSTALYSGSVNLLTGSLNHNGDDAIELFNTTTSSTIDIIGRIGEDPGAAWIGGGLSTVNRTIIRNASITVGIQINPSTGFPTLATEWNGLDLDDVTNLGTHTATSCVSNNITISNLSATNFTVSCATNDIGSIDFSYSGTFNAGNTLIVQLSNSSGSFSSPLNIGSIASSSSSGNISFSIPPGTPSGNDYLIRIVSSEPNTTSNISSAISITLNGAPCTLTPPYMTSLIYDGCNVACSGSTTEGRSEIMFGNTGGYSVEVNPTNVEFIYNSNVNQPLTDGIVNNPSTTTNLNAEAGCPGLFLNGFGQTLGPNTSFLIVSENLCISSLIWSDLCGSGPIYVLYADASPTTWDDGGNFGNSAGTRNLQTIVTATDGSVHDISYSYTSVNGGDGSYAAWTSEGGNPSTSGVFTNCRISPIALPTGLSFFKGYSEDQNVILSWQTQSEQNNDHFTILHSQNGYDFTGIGNVNGAGNSNSTISYSFVHNRPSKGINYYKLTSTDYDGTRYNKGIVSVMVESAGTYYDVQTSQLQFGEAGDYNIYALDGKLLGSVENGSSVLFDHHGMILIQDLKTGRSERLFVP